MYPAISKTCTTVSSTSLLNSFIDISEEFIHKNINKEEIAIEIKTNNNDENNNNSIENNQSLKVARARMHDNWWFESLLNNH